MAELVDLRQAAKELSISIHCLRAWTYQKKISFVRLGRRVLLRREDLEGFITKNLHEARDQR